MYEYIRPNIVKSSTARKTVALNADAFVNTQNFCFIPTLFNAYR